MSTDTQTTNPETEATEKPTGILDFEIKNGEAFVPIKNPFKAGGEEVKRVRITLPRAGVVMRLNGSGFDVSADGSFKINYDTIGKILGEYNCFTEKGAPIKTTIIESMHIVDFTACCTAYMTLFGQAGASAGN